MIQFIIRFLQRFRAVHGNTVKLKALRISNPDCVIMSPDLLDVSLGDKVVILDGVCLNRVTIGNFSYVSNQSKLHHVKVGRFCSIGPNIQIGLETHPAKVFVSTYPAFYSNHNTGCPQTFRKSKIFDDSVAKTIIGNDVWVGSNVIIPGGIKIGTGAIIAAGSVVVKDVPQYAVVGGNPAIVIRYRFSDEQIEVLLESEWWNWSIEKIIRNVACFSDIEKFKEIIS